MRATIHLGQLVEADSPESLLSRLSGQAELTVLGQDHHSGVGHMPLGHTASTVASLSRRPVVAVPRGWTPQAADRRPIAVAIDGQHPSLSTLGFAFGEASLRRVPILVIHSAPLAELTDGDQDTRLNLAEILAGWRPTIPTSRWTPKCWPVHLVTPLPRRQRMRNCLSSAAGTAAGNGRAGSAQ